MLKKLLSKYKYELYEVLANLPYSEYGVLESLVLYSYVREEKPKVAVEVGTERFSRSTHLIQKALLKNGDFTHYMVDLPDVIDDARKNLFDTTNTMYVAGNFQDVYKAIPWDKVDFLFIDADHTKDFGDWYIKTIIPLLVKGTLVHIHDINLSGDWKLREDKTNEVTAISDAHKNETLGLEKVVWLEDYSINPEYEDRWEELREMFPMIGRFPAPRLPFGSSASYWRKL